MSESDPEYPEVERRRKHSERRKYSRRRKRVLQSMFGHPLLITTLTLTATGAATFVAYVWNTLDEVKLTQSTNQRFIPLLERIDMQQGKVIERVQELERLVWQHKGEHGDDCEDTR